MSPFFDTLYIKSGLALCLLIWAAWIQFAGESWSSFMQSMMEGRASSSLLTVLLSTVVPFGNLEWAALMTTNLGLFEHHTPIATRALNGFQDWREYHVVDDSRREQDPVLFWRSRAGSPPFSSQGFKTEIEMQIPKPDNVFRIIAYGDSNTEGTLSMDWSEDMQAILAKRNSPERVYEMINAGVGGYSSYQGVQRFLQEWETYEPDIVLVAFGWNDLPRAVDRPDKSHKVQTDTVIGLLRVLVNYRFYQAIQHYVVSARLQKKKATAVSRVPLNDYLENMTIFSETSSKNNISVVFLTRPYRDPTAQVLQEPNYQAKAPLYNQALIEFALGRGEHLVDVQHYFEEETTGLFSDATHFNREGVAEMARFLVHRLDDTGLLQGRENQLPEPK